MSTIALDHVAYTYPGAKKPVFKDYSYSFEPGKITSIVGRSGAGKTTLLSLLSGLAAPTEGKILLDGEDIQSQDKYDYRSHSVGVIFQSFNLLPTLTAVENVVLSMDIAQVQSKNKTADALELLERVGLTSDEAQRRVLKLSGGQQQRVAIARALSYYPDIVLADEPTGNLDPDTTSQILQIFHSLAHDEGKCVILVTHSQVVADASDEVWHLKK